LTGLPALCLYAFMRTTVELPPSLMRAAKARSAEAGESLKALLARAVAAELGRDAAPSASGARVVLPLFGAGSGPRANLSNADLERALADADAALVPAARAPRRRRPSR
jgi:hypothetical protein